jgi:hypothetical protein
MQQENGLDEFRSGNISIPIYALVTCVVSFLHVFRLKLCAREQTGKKTGFSPRPSVSPVNIIPPLLHIHSYVDLGGGGGGANNKKREFL